MYTELGKWLKTFRLTQGIRLYDMAARLGYTSAFLSAIENGKKNAPVNFGDKVTEEYHLSEEQQKELNEAIIASREQAYKPNAAIRLRIDNPCKGVDSLAYCFARKVNHLTSEQRTELLKILNQEETSVSN